MPHPVIASLNAHKGDGKVGAIVFVHKDNSVILKANGLVFKYNSEGDNDDRMSVGEFWHPFCNTMVNE